MVAAFATVLAIRQSGKAAGKQAAQAAQVKVDIKGWRMPVKLVLKLTRWTMMLSVIALASGCGTVPGNYCAVAQKPL
ncbi:hypothetical protein RE432_16330 [Pusillimonas sp. SM2304]|uniref:hypothetical protein n=1 Tax=Pusillimonas sp. SM2304 TaxID=3073241 RepID=UPI00287714A6|nr:hypothetical protein [Pusillimonas sp. SM2304]MDS1142011.1 hypothetical protein [Pusillimonas sp. SM2304]